jgi:hypothetical protein
MSPVGAHTSTHHRQLDGGAAGNVRHMLSAVLSANDVYTFGADVVHKRMALARHWVAFRGGGVAMSECTTPRVRC